MSGPPDRAPDLRGVRAWIITDGKAGDENQCLGVAEVLGVDCDLRHVPRGGLFAWAAPWGPIDPRQGSGRGVLAGPWPDLVIASGRRAVPYLRAVRRRSGGATFTAFLKDPRTGPGTADFVWVPAHDRLRAANVLATPTGPHRVTPARLAAARSAPDPRLASLPRPRVAVLIGGDSRHLRYQTQDVARLLAGLHHLAAEGCALMITTSRRTPPSLRAAVRALAVETGGFCWDGGADNPYVAMLALADAVVATSDSTNLVGEAASTGAPILLFELPGTHMRHRGLFDALAEAGAVRPFTGRWESWAYEPIDATPQIARALARAYAGHRRAGAA